MRMPRDWDARTYDRVADPMTRWGEAVLERLPLTGDERVLDAGCGSGRVTELLAGGLPRGQVVALDGSPAMVEAARSACPASATGSSTWSPTSVRPLPIEPVDAILSTATFHWVPDHDALFRNLAARPAAGWPARRAMWRCRQHRLDPTRCLPRSGTAGTGDVYFATPLETVRRLEAAGFVDLEVWLTDEPTRFEPGEPLEAYLRTVVLGATSNGSPHPSTTRSCAPWQTACRSP